MKNYMQCAMKDDILKYREEIGGQSMQWNYNEPNLDFATNYQEVLEIYKKCLLRRSQKTKSRKVVKCSTLQKCGIED